MNTAVEFGVENLTKLLVEKFVHVDGKELVRLVVVKRAYTGYSMRKSLNLKLQYS